MSAPEIHDAIPGNSDGLSGMRTYIYRLVAVAPGTYEIPAVVMIVLRSRNGSVRRVARPAVHDLGRFRRRGGCGSVTVGSRFATGREVVELPYPVDDHLWLVRCRHGTGDRRARLPEPVHVGVGRQFVLNVEVSGTQQLDTDPALPDMEGLRQLSECGNVHVDSDGERAHQRGGHLPVPLPGADGRARSRSVRSRSPPGIAPWPRSRCR